MQLAGPNNKRNEPAVIKRRLIVIYATYGISLLMLLDTESPRLFAILVNFNSWNLAGILFILVIYSKDIYAYLSELQSSSAAESSKSMWTEWTEWRDYCLAPLAEELLFKHIIYWKLLQRHSLTCSILFSLSHAHHHLIAIVFTGGSKSSDISDNRWSALIVTCLYTFLFQLYTCWTMADSMLLCFLTHALCNYFGLPQILMSQ